MCCFGPILEIKLSNSCNEDLQQRQNILAMNSFKCDCDIHGKFDNYNSPKAPFSAPCSLKHCCSAIGNIYTDTVASLISFKLTNQYQLVSTKYLYVFYFSKPQH